MKITINKRYSCEDLSTVFTVIQNDKVINNFSIEDMYMEEFVRVLK